MTRGRSEQILTWKLEGGALTRAPDDMVVEEPMAIHLDDHLVATTMRTPGDDFELAVGFCITEGLLGEAKVTGIRYCGTGPAVDTDFNVVSVDTGNTAPVPTPRLTTASSSCGLCGSQDLAELAERLTPLADGPAFPIDLLATLPAQARTSQKLFDATGSVHAAAAFDRSGDLLALREDIGRHNAVDKVIGHLQLNALLPAHDLALYVSGRASFEIAQKAWAAGFRAVVAVSAPSALAVQTARRAGIQLVGFVRGDRATVYAPAERPGV